MGSSDFIAVMLGAILAIVTSFVTQLYTEWREIRNKRIQLKRFLVAELSNNVSRLDSLLRIYKQSQSLDPLLLVSTERMTNLFEKYREQAYLLDIETSRQVLTFYDTVGRAAEVIFSMLRLAQNRKFEDYATDEIRKQVSQIGEALSLGKDLEAQFNAKTARRSFLAPRRKKHGAHT